nr:RNA-directed DNA polymerase, eukaryota, reverse transcriptase zinc-binding domain protein [Tanacetum cinerariifolium]
MWGNFKFDYACSMARGRSGGLVTMWDPNVFIKTQIWCSDNYVIVEGKWMNSVEYSYLINMKSKMSFGIVVSKKPRSLMAFRLCLSRSIETFYIQIFRLPLMTFSHLIFAKILANQLSKVIDSIISHGQYAFILGRQILDGPLILSEVINWYKKQKKKMILFKVDFEKAFDSADLISSRASILVIGSPTSEFSLKIGLRPVNGGRAYAGINILITDISSLILPDGGDRIFSSFSTDGIYSVSDVRKHIDDCFLLNSLPCTRWFKVIPQKADLISSRASILVIGSPTSEFSLKRGL